MTSTDKNLISILCMYAYDLVMFMECGVLSSDSLVHLGSAPVLKKHFLEVYTVNGVHYNM